MGDIRIKLILYKGIYATILVVAAGLRHPVKRLHENHMLRLERLFQRQAPGRRVTGFPENPWLPHGPWPVRTAIKLYLHKMQCMGHWPEPECVGSRPNEHDPDCGPAPRLLAWRDLSDDAAVTNPQDLFPIRLKIIGHAP